MGTKHQKEFTVPGLGRPAFIGQIYNGATEQLLNTQLFKKDDLEGNIKEDDQGYTKIEYNEVKSHSDRASSLKISAELSVSILGGLVSLSGSGEYLEHGKSNVTSHELAMTCLVVKKNKRLEVGQCVKEETWKRVKALGGTHVVTAIRYGGNLVANIMKKESYSESDKSIKGSLSVDVLKGMSIAFSGSGKASVDSFESAKDWNKSCNFKVFGDWASADEPLPMTIGGVFELVKKWPSLVKEGIPCEITLTPIPQFVDSSPEAMKLYELEQHKLLSICQVYDELFLLDARRGRLVAVLEGSIGDFCPTFLKECRERKVVVEKALSKAREELSQYLVAVRKDGAEKVEGVEEFLSRVRREFTDGNNACKKDESTLDLFNSIQTLARAQSVPLASIKDIRNNMTKVGSGVVGVVIIPPKPNISSATNTFDLLVKSIRTWREEEDKKEATADGTAPKTSFSAYFADPEFDVEFLKLDGPRDTLKKGLEQARSSSESRFIHYGLLPQQTVRKEYDWCLLNDQGWGFLASETENYYYVGQVQAGKRHGRGSITYDDGSVYTGDWWDDMRHGEGKLVENDGDSQTETSGIFIENVRRPDGIIIKLIVYRNDQVPIAAYRIPLRKYDATPSHILRIGNMLGWIDKDEFLLEVVSKSKAFQTMRMEVKGKMLMPGADDKLQTTSWPLDQGVVELRAIMLR